MTDAEEQVTDLDSEDSLSTAPVLHECYQPTKGRPFGCMGCSIFQFTDAFKEKDKAEYKAVINPKAEKADKCTYQIQGTGPLTAKIMVVLESPTMMEDAKGKCAIGSGAISIRRNAAEFGLNADKWYFTYAVKCRGQEPPKVAKAVYCTKFLAEEIQKIKPDIILACGSLPTALLLGKPKASAIAYHCVPQTVTVAGHTCSVYPIWSADYVRRNDHLNKRYLDAFEKFARFVRGEEIVAVDESTYEMVNDVQDAIALCQRILVDRIEQGKCWLDVDLETTGLKPFRKGQRVTTISMAYSFKKGYAIPYSHNDIPWTDEDRKRFVEEGLKPLLTHPAIKLRWANGKFDYQWFPLYFGFTPRDIYQDGMLAHYASNENEEHGLKPLALRYTDMGDYDHELDTYLKANFPADDPHYDLVPWPLLGKYAAMDTVASKKIAKTIKEHVAAQSDPAVHALAYKAMPAYSAAITRLEQNGIQVDVDFATKAVPIFEANEKRSLEAVLADPIVRKFCRDREQKERNKRKHPEKLPGIETKQYFQFSMNGAQQLGELLFDSKYYGHEPIAFTDSGAPATDKEVMKALAEQGSPIAKRIEEYRLDSKLLGTFIRPTIDDATLNIHPMRHPNFSLARAKTGRLTCNDGLHQIPNKGAGLIKRMFISRYGDEGCIVQADFSQVELRILACLANDKGMINAFKDGVDPHMLTAMAVFDLDEAAWKALSEKDKKEKRTTAKRLNFGLCLLEGTPVMTKRGFVPIEDVLGSDELWDGEQWVTHGGVVCTGVKETIDIGGVFCTPEHEVLTDEGWVTALCHTQAKGENPYQLSGTLTESGQFVMSRPENSEVLSNSRRSVNADMNWFSQASQHLIYSAEKAHSATFALELLAKSLSESIMGTLRSYRTLKYVNCGLVDTSICYEGAITLRAVISWIMGRVASRFISYFTTRKSSYATPSHSRGGMNLDSLWIESIMKRVTNRETCASLSRTGTIVTRVRQYGSNIMVNACVLRNLRKSTVQSMLGSIPFSVNLGLELHRSKLLSNNHVVEVRTGKVYDIVNSGPNHRFQAGKYIVHNCYGTGAQGIESMLKSDGVTKTVEECQTYIDKFFLAKPKVKRWIDLVKASTSEESMSKSLFGRRRRLEQVQSIIEGVVAAAHRQAVNHPIQSCSADITLCSLTLMDEEICLRRGDDVNMLHPTMEHRSFPVDARWQRVHQILTVHDSIVTDCHKDVAADVIKMMQDTMPNICDLAHYIWGQEIEDNLACLRKVPLAIEVEVGPNYRDAVQTKDPVGWEKAYFLACQKRTAMDADYKYKWAEADNTRANEAWIKHKADQDLAKRSNASA